MSLTWAEMRKLFLEGTGNTGSGDQETWVHLTEGYRRTAEPLDIPELTQPEAYVSLVQGDDYFDTDCDVFAIKTLVNLTEGHEMYPEPAGMTGRNRYIEATTGTRGTPPEGSPTHWVRDGNRIYIRDAASEATNIAIRFKVQVPELSSSDANDYPLTPAQYDHAILHAALASYFSLHPKADQAPEGQPPPSVKHTQSFQRIMTSAGSEHPRSIEAKSSRNTMRLAGYRIGGRAF